MNHSEKSELLSAYLDKEVTAHEQAELEQLLESDPQSRHLLEQLAQLGDLLREQPQQKVRPSFTSDVMAGVRREAVRRQQAAGSHGVAQGESDGELSSAYEQPIHDSQREEAAPHTHVMLAKQGDTKGNRRWQFICLWAATAAAVLLIMYTAGKLYDPSNLPTERIVESPGDSAPPNLPRDPEPVIGGPERLVVRPEERPSVPSVPAMENLPEHDEPPGTSTPVDPQNIAEAVPNIVIGEPRPATPEVIDPASPFVEGGFTAEDQRILRLLESLVVVSIECTPVTAQQREFDKILKKYKIKVAEKAAAEAPVVTTEVYYIESSVSQAEAVLNEVSSRNTEFTSMVMRTETTQTQNALNLQTGAEEQPRPDPQELQVPEGRGSFAERFRLETPEELAALPPSREGEAPSSADVYPLLGGDSGLNALLGASDVEAEHLVRMLVVLRTVQPQNEN